MKHCLFVCFAVVCAGFLRADGDAFVNNYQTPPTSAKSEVNFSWKTYPGAFQDGIGNKDPNSQTAAASSYLDPNAPTGSGMSDGAIAGTVVGSLAGAAGAVGGGVMAVKKWRNRAKKKGSASAGASSATAAAYVVPGELVSAGSLGRVLGEEYKDADATKMVAKPGGYDVPAASVSGSDDPYATEGKGEGMRLKSSVADSSVGIPDARKPVLPPHVPASSASSSARSPRASDHSGVPKLAISQARTASSLRTVSSASVSPRSGRAIPAAAGSSRMMAKPRRALLNGVAKAAARLGRRQGT